MCKQVLQCVFALLIDNFFPCGFLATQCRQKFDVQYHEYIEYLHIPIPSVAASYAMMQPILNRMHDKIASKFDAVARYIHTAIIILSVVFLLWLSKFT
jgi:hypothetical protein